MKFNPFAEVGHAPEFIQRLPENAEIAKGEFLELITEIGGDPQPVVEWSKDGVSINGLPDFHVSF
jgi:hypothetical protein